jgi:hypothetical protein
MGLVQNLKRTLTNWADKILVELSCLYIKQVAKQTLKKQDNSLHTESLPNHLTQEDLPTTIVTSSADTSEKIIMEKTTETLVGEITEWAMDRFDIEKMPLGDCRALYEEYAEWFEPQGQDLEVLSLDEITPEEFVRYQERT